MLQIQSKGVLESTGWIRELPILASQHSTSRRSPHSLVIWSSSVFRWDSRPSISRPLMEQRPAGKHKSKMAGTVTPGITMKSLSFRLRKFALLWEFPELTFFFNCIT